MSGVPVELEMLSSAVLKESLDILKKQCAELKAQEMLEKKATGSGKKSKKWLRDDETGDKELLKKKKKADASASTKKKTKEKLVKKENWRYAEEGKECTWCVRQEVICEVPAEGTSLVCHWCIRLKQSCSRVGEKKKGKGKGMEVEPVREKSVVSVSDGEEEEEGKSMPEWFEWIDQS
ncbi:hypothetical protein FISHEDRAFT_69711 [Fistulina hepatica ATCC 64428]|uniref:Uncharacterized protein n=1 Tax=Fistulina hepatica ATCC 64428 TaxID=1128425 RepID=A0A0D7AL28_9AGAR|nr:hypothetical protein FISHEDRAFT_69711 [Fistulina hepatica ATCC 64428]